MRNPFKKKEDPAPMEITVTSGRVAVVEHGVDITDAVTRVALILGDGAIIEATIDIRQSDGTIRSESWR